MTTRNRIANAFTETTKEKKYEYQAEGNGCYTIDQYNKALDAGWYIRDGFWWVDDYNCVGKADPREIEIANLFTRYDPIDNPDKPTMKTFNRLGFID